jgi:hypothetical protein
MQFGDVIVFDGGNWSDVSHLVTDFAPNAIQVVENGTLTHAGMVWDDGLLIESTILKGVSGPQLNPLRSRLADYPGRAWWLPMDDPIRRYIDIPSMRDLGQAKVGKDRYNVGELFQYIGRKVPFLSWAPFVWKANPKSEVCSELCVELLRAGGLPGLTPNQITPQELAELKIYRAATSCAATCHSAAPCLGYTQLVGTPGLIRNYNTI